MENTTRFSSHCTSFAFCAFLSSRMDSTHIVTGKHSTLRINPWIWANVPEQFIAETAKSLGMTVSEVYGAASFYSFLSRKPQGRHVIRVCGNIPCYLKGSDMIVEGIRKELGISPGETTPDKKFSFELTNCIGACDTAPAMLIDDEVHGGLTVEKIADVLKRYA